MLRPLLGELRATRLIVRPRTRPDRLHGDKAYSSRAIRAHLRSCGIEAIMPEPRDQQGHHKRRGPHADRPVSYNPVDYKQRKVIKRGFCRLKQCLGLAVRYGELAII